MQPQPQAFPQAQPQPQPLPQPQFQPAARTTCPDSFRPTPARLVLPCVLVLLLLLSHVALLTYGPSLGDGLCEVVGLTLEMSDTAMGMRLQTYTLNQDPDEVVSSLEHHNELSNRVAVVYNEFQPTLGRVMLLTYPVQALGLYSWLPGYPAPCLFEEGDSGSCVHYFTEESYGCLRDYTKEMGSRGSVTLGSLLSPLDDQYRGVSHISWLLSTLFAGVICYAVVCLLSAGIRSVVRNPQLLRILSVVFILLVIASLVILFSFGARGASRESGRQREMVVSEYDVVFCENTALLSPEQKEEMGISADRGVDEEIIKGEWKVCSSPDCGEICRERFPTSICQVGIDAFMLRGERPSCVCGCETYKAPY